MPFSYLEAAVQMEKLIFLVCARNCRQQRIDTEIKEHTLFWNLLILTSLFSVVLKQLLQDQRYRTIWSIIFCWTGFMGCPSLIKSKFSLKLLACSWLLNLVITLSKLLWQVNPYYDFEDVIDSDEELDLASMATWKWFPWSVWRLQILSYLYNICTCFYIVFEVTWVKLLLKYLFLQSCLAR